MAHNAMATFGFRMDERLGVVKQWGQAYRSMNSISFWAGKLPGRHPDVSYVSGFSDSVASARHSLHSSPRIGWPSSSMKSSDGQWEHPAAKCHVSASGSFL